MFGESGDRERGPARAWLGFVAIVLSIACRASAPSVPELELAPAAPGAEVVEGAVYAAARPQAPVVTAANLAENERFWPHQIALTRDWKPARWEGDFGWGLGVLLRVDPRKGLRVDFSRFGKHWIPVDATDVIERANAVRLGAEHKFAPNLVLALGNRLLDPTGRELTEIREDPLDQRAFVLVFADPRGEAFEALARDLSAVDERGDVLVVLLPQGGHADAHVYKACFDAGFRGAFLFDRFVGAYTEGYVDVPLPGPFIQVATPEGRLLWEGDWAAGLGSTLRARFADS